jgi:hypothetical protein
MSPLRSVSPTATHQIGEVPDNCQPTGMSTTELPPPAVAHQRKNSTDWFSWWWSLRKCGMEQSCCCFECIAGLIFGLIAFAVGAVIFGIVAGVIIILYSYPLAAMLLSLSSIGFGVMLLFLIAGMFYCFCCPCLNVGSIRECLKESILPIGIYLLALPLSIVSEIAHMINCLMDLVLFPYMLVFAFKLFIAQVQDKSTVYSILSAYQVYQLILLIVLSPYVLAQVLTILDKENLETSRSMYNVHQRFLSRVGESKKPWWQPWWWIEEFTTQKLIYFLGFKVFHVQTCAETLVVLLKQQFCVLDFPQKLLGPKKYAFFVDLCLHTIPITLAVVFLPFANNLMNLKYVRIGTGVVSLIGGIRIVLEDEVLLNATLMAAQVCCGILCMLSGMDSAPIFVAPVQYPAVPAPLANAPDENKV